MVLTRPVHVVVIGGGATGTLMALQLLRQGRPVVVTVVEPGPLGAGVAYGTADPDHLLNVPCGSMSAYEDDPHHFTSWVRTNFRPVQPNEYLPRLLVGPYLRDQLASACSTAGGPCLQLVQRRAVRVDGRQRRVVLDDGAALSADHVVLALGNRLPSDPAGLARAGDRYVADPWSTGWLRELDADDRVLLVGTGLTAVDVAITLAGQGHRGRIDAVSRHGRLPAGHAADPSPRGAPCVRPGEPDAASALGLWRAVRDEIDRRAAAGEDWRPVIDGLRPVTAELWSGLPTHERERFLRHVARCWDLVRHRLAPGAAARIDELQSRGQLHVHRGRIVSVRAGDASAVVVARRGHACRRFEVAAVVNCTGPATDPSTSPDPLLVSLLGDGTARRDPLGLGLDVDPAGAVVAADGQPSDSLWALGALRKGSLWESTAVPELRAQTTSLARRLCLN